MMKELIINKMNNNQIKIQFKNIFFRKIIKICFKISKKIKYIIFI